MAVADLLGDIRSIFFRQAIGPVGVPAFAESFGIDAYRPEDWGELESALDEAVGSDELSLVEVVLE